LFATDKDAIERQKYRAIERQDLQAGAWAAARRWNLPRIG